MSDSVPDVVDAADNPPLLTLEPIEARILGCLLEKQATTPDAYPLTLNAVVTACNQKSNREPVTHFEPGEVGHALRQLEGKGLVRGSLAARASRYAHCVDTNYNVTARQRAVLCLLFLRGPQTLGELLTRSDRIGDFANLDDVRAVVERLCTREPALVVNMGRSAGQREDRYMHLLCGPVVASSQPLAAQPASETGIDLVERVAELEVLVAQLQDAVAALQASAGEASHGNPAMDDTE